MREKSQTFKDLILTKELGYGDVSEAALLLTEVSKLLEAYSRNILNSDY